MKVSRCRGTRDLLPRDMARFRKIESEFRSACLEWGYREIRTPTLEYLHLFTSAGTLSPDMLERVYSFLDWDGWSGERVALRPDGTIPVARLYVENFQHLPVAKLFYVENTFVFEGSGKESRERWQCGAELIGGARPLGDVELLSLALDCVARLLGRPAQVRLAHAGVLKTFLEEMGLTGEEEATVIDRIFSGDLSVLRRLKSGNASVEEYVRLLFGLKGQSAGFVENLRSICAPAFPAMKPGLDELGAIAASLDKLGFAYEIDLASGRGFEYYTGIMFEFQAEGRRLGGGGRYDELIPLVGGERVHASGFALYADELMELIPEPLEQEKVLIKTGDGRSLSSCLDIARRLRQEGYIVEVDLGCIDSEFNWIIEVLVGGDVELTDSSGKVRRLAPDPAELANAIRGAR